MSGNKEAWTYESFMDHLKWPQPPLARDAGGLEGYSMVTTVTKQDGIWVLGQPCYWDGIDGMYKLSFDGGQTWL